ncbi:hypothetical protein NEUTE2DRAFT_69131 [Neurospora tetrasperma FGSC 2509]|nr:hypothetical protein NEUTE2DRAFT_69131 [Neurospora tetrasperma FGSC 2509]
MQRISVLCGPPNKYVASAAAVLCRTQTLKAVEKRKTRLPRIKAVTGTASRHLDRRSINQPPSKSLVVVYSPEILGKSGLCATLLFELFEDLFLGSKPVSFQFKGKEAHRFEVDGCAVCSVVAELARYNSGAFASSFVAMSISDDTEQTRLQIDFQKMTGNRTSCHDAVLSEPRLPDIAFLFILGCLGNGSLPCSPGSIWNATMVRTYLEEERSSGNYVHPFKRVPTLSRHNCGCDWLMAAHGLLPLLPVTELPPQNGPPNSAGIPEHGMGERERCPIKKEPPPL